MRIEEEFENVMMNIEIQVVDITGKNQEMTDWDVEKVYNALLSKYKAIIRGRVVKKVSFKPPVSDLYFQIAAICRTFAHFLMQKQNFATPIYGSVPD